ncbi:DUF3102 domain-containing protein [Castellaniella caeni]|uniref:DUF3102 domain-containing protein n=1 Tax=Castellaniella caeni TaxID=266123 RepID=UPI000C9F16F9|nr:DUF3102 domain-containing protein [Castellaniella caeni]
MARPKTTLADQAPDMNIEQAEALDSVQHAEVERMAVILRQFSDGIPFEPYRYELIIREHLSRSAEAMLAAGRALIVAKESLGHGDWLPFVERVGVEERVARRMIQAAFKFSDPKTIKLIEAAGNKSKLFELMVLDDEEIAELADGGTVVGLELDDVERMGTRELRAALRDARAEDQAKDKLLADKNTAIDRLTAEVQKARSRIQRATVDEQIVAATNDVAGVCIGLTAEILTPLREAAGRLLALSPDAGAAIAGHVTQVRQALDEISAEFNLGTVTSLVPDWATAEEE